MSAVATVGRGIRAMTPGALEEVSRVESAMMALPQHRIPVHHAIHGGMYARTVRIPAGVMISGAHVVVPTILVVSGRMSAFANGEWMEIDGHQVVVASAGRKQLFVAHEDTDLTMLFATGARTVREAEEEFTSQPDALASRSHEDINTEIITGE